jgi:two-component system cell cycle response regulator DivK
MSKRILVIEDSDINRRLMRDILLNHGFEVLEAVDGKEGIETARRERPDLILLDMQMPVMNGFDVLKEMRSDPALHEIKIIVVTSYAMTGDRERIIEAGADDYIAKPIDTRELPERIRRLL